MRSSRTVVVDASLAIRAVLPTPDRTSALDRFVTWHRERRWLLAPALWLAEAVSVLRLQVFSEQLSYAEGLAAVADVRDLGVEIVAMEGDLCLAAFEWAERLQQARAYDAFYFALAQREGASLWTADRRLARRAAQPGVDWVHDHLAADGED